MKDMTKRDEDLDAILEVLMFNVQPDFKKLIKSSYGTDKLTKESLKESLSKLNAEDWVFDKYLDKLEKDGFIETDLNGFISITNDGENFKIKYGGFRGVAKKESKELERQRNKDWILRFDRKWRIPAAIIAVLAIFLSILKCSNS